MTMTFEIANGDVVLDTQNGQPKEVTGKVKTRQDLKEVLSIETKYDGFGAGLDDIVGTMMPLGGFSLRAEITRKIRGTIAVMQSLQNQFQRQYRTNDEIIYGVANLQVVAVRDNTGALSKTDSSFSVDILTLEGAETLVVAGVI